MDWQRNRISSREKAGTSRDWGILERESASDLASVRITGVEGLRRGSKKEQLMGSIVLAEQCLTCGLRPCWVLYIRYHVYQIVRIYKSGKIRVTK